ncbi:trk system potassium uptake protein TrkH [Bacillus iocasae]|uniref:Trk system potassium uptake protein TrkH n=2 Tax=Priestia iocasae TaxID=2291674 RepID=A0ABS2QX34_9BACI|nr:TrkH family potassium uptake protein [Metabacillus iocasae]MBM7703039.1 trk system potassium uptake protein TrkH [Metabacillus iocasae]
MKTKSIQLSPPQLLVAVFGVCIIAGAVLLKLPFSTTHSIKWIDAMFTATSAMTVTGLAVMDTGTEFTIFGQIVIMCLIQLGGLGIMSFAVLIFMVLGKRIGFKQRLLIQQSLNQTNIGGVIRLVKHLFIFSFLIEGVAMLFLAIRWVPEYGWGKGLYYSLFHSISSFNNAGFALWSDGLTRYVGDPIVNVTISLLFIIGGIGFTVLVDIWQKRSYKKLSLHSKMMLIGTLVINTVAMILIFFLEYANPKTLGGLDWSEKVWAAYFQAVTTRTAGFNTIDIGSMDESTIFLMLLLMFVGAGSASTGGGIKLTTFIIIILAVLAFLRARDDLNILKRRIDVSFVFRALAISTMGVLFIFSAIFILNISESERIPFLELVFEVISAFGTVGLSMGVTADLSDFGRFIIIFIMFLGKLGPLTLAFSLAKPQRSAIRYPSEDVLTG